MSNRLRQFLIEAYERRLPGASTKHKKDTPVQIDDQDDRDSIDEFCTIFIQVRDRGNMEIELLGRIPITPEIADLAEIYGGYADAKKGRIILNINTQQVEVLKDLAARLRDTAFMGMAIDNPNWHRVSARTISSLLRFVRIIKEFEKLWGVAG